MQKTASELVAIINEYLPELNKLNEEGSSAKPFLTNGVKKKSLAI
jgi:hypothetical protein